MTKHKYTIALRDHGVIRGYPWQKEHHFETWRDLLAAFPRTIGSHILQNGEVLCNSDELSDILYWLKHEKTHPSYKKIMERLPGHRESLYIATLEESEAIFRQARDGN